jgi:cytochrome c heme-lyase
MHNKMSPAAAAAPATAEVPKGACPYVPPENAADAAPEAPKGLLARLNPLNNMFAELDNSKASTQTRDLPLSREASTIPKGDGTLWEYPSPQQMYNAMLRKGYTDTPVEAVESMVSVHNFLNEGAWAEIMGWERRFSRGLVDGYQICKQGEALANLRLGTADNPFDTTTWVDDDVPPPKLLRFTGRPTEPTPKSQIMQALGWAMPEKFGTPPPFDRHDWFIQRCNKQGCKEVRYVIDYYEGEDHSEDEPVFHLDVRPAIDGPVSAAERLIRSGTELWWEASGGSARMLRKLEEAKKKREEEAAAKGRQYN